jgi:hypothetical protein
MGLLRTTRRGNATTISYDGPFFTKDPGDTFEENVDTMLRAMAKEGAEDVRAQINARSGSMERSTGWSAAHIAARHNIPWREGKGYTLVWVSTDGMEGSMAERTKAAVAGRRKEHPALGIEDRWHPFRVTKNRLSKARALQKAELTKGME